MQGASKIAEGPIDQLAPGTVGAEAEGQAGLLPLRAVVGPPFPALDRLSPASAGLAPFGLGVGLARFRWQGPAALAALVPPGQQLVQQGLRLLGAGRWLDLGQGPELVAIAADQQAAAGRRSCGGG